MAKHFMSAIWWQSSPQARSQRKQRAKQKQLGIKVWGRGKIRQLMSKLENAEDYYLSA